MLAVLIGLWVVRSITKPIVELSQATAGLGREPLSSDHPALERADEIGELARSFREISQGLHQTFFEFSEAERRLSTAQGVAHIGSWELDLDTGLMWGSEEAIRIYGLAATPSGRLPLEAIRGVPLEDDRPRLDRAMADLLAGRGGYALEIRIRRPSDGQIRGIYSQATLVAGQDRAASKVVGIIQDITERQRADADIRRQAEELTALNALSRDLNRDLSLRHTVRAALKGLLETLHPDKVFLFLRQGESLVLQDALPAEAGPPLAAVGEHQVGQCICGLAASEQQPLFSQDIAQDSRCTWTECKAAGIRSAAAVPFFSADEVIGVIGLASRSERDFQAQSDFLETFAGHVSVAITNAQLFEKVQQELAERQRTMAVLNQSQDRYRALSHQSPLGISLIAPDGRYEYINTAFTEMFGYTLEDISTRDDWFRQAYPDQAYRQEVIQSWTHDLTNVKPGRSLARTLRVTTKDGVLKDILLRVVALFSGGHFIIYEDITERLRAEERLRQSEERFRHFIERSPVPIVIINANQELEYSNPKFSQTYGYERGYFPSLDVWWEKAYPDLEYRQEVKTSWLKRVDEARLNGTDVAHLERRVRCRDGSYKTVSFYGAPVGDKVMVVLLDVTAEREAAQALLDSEARFRRFVESTPVGIHMYRHLGGGRLEFAGFNPAANRILGLDHSQLLDKSIEEAFPALANTNIPERYLWVAEHGEVWRDENVTYEHGRVSGAYELTAFQTTPGSMAVMFNDITQRLQIQEDLRILEHQLVRSQKLEALGTLASGIAHDFNNILQALHGRIQLLAGDRGLPETSRSHIENMQRSIVRASNLVARMLSFSRKGESNLSVLDLNAEVLSAVEMLAHALPKMVELQTDLASDAGYILGDANRLEQVFLNLATNARDAMPEGGALLLRSRRREVGRDSETQAGLTPGDYVVLEVSDTGQGMDAKTLAHIFEPFFSTKEPGKGTGLGLYSAFGIIRDHNGTITCQSRPGHGTTFTVIFPRVSAQEDLDQTTPPEASAQIAGDGEAILVVDDEPEVLEPLAEALVAYGYRVHKAGSGEEALAILEVPGLLIDLILMDLNMPGMGGEKALAEIKADYPDVLVIVSSGYQDRTLKKRLLGQRGADYFIGKPFNFKELLAALRHMLDNRPARS
ncbi:MAG: PAS domain S-box protein [Pseudomonadota bacterium]